MLLCEWGVDGGIGPKQVEKVSQSGGACGGGWRGPLWGTGTSGRAWGKSTGKTRVVAWGWATQGFGGLAPRVWTWPVGDTVPLEEKDVVPSLLSVLGTVGLIKAYRKEPFCPFLWCQYLGGDRLQAAHVMSQVGRQSWGGPGLLGWAKLQHMAAGCWGAGRADVLVTASEQAGSSHLPPPPSPAQPSTGLAPRAGNILGAAEPSGVSHPIFWRNP